MKNDNEWGKSYYKLNTSLLEDAEYDKIVDETVAEINTLSNRTQREKWEIFMMTMQTKSIQYSTKRNLAKKRLKNELFRQILKIEERKNQDTLVEHYEYLKGRLKEIEDKEIEGYIRRVKFLAPYDKTEADIAFYSKLENQKRANDRMNQLAEKKEGKIYTDNKNILQSFTTKFYKDLYTPDKVNEKVQNKLLSNVKTKLSKVAPCDKAPKSKPKSGRG